MSEPKNAVGFIKEPQRSIKLSGNMITILLDEKGEATVKSQVSDLPQQLDITGAKFVQVEIDHKRKVLYVHVDGYSVLRVCRIEKILPTTEHNNPKQLSDPEWRTIHNALVAYKYSYNVTSELSRKEIQQLMDKVPDNHITK